MRARGDLSSQYSLLQALLYLLFSCDRRIWFEQKWEPKEEQRIVAAL